jgi:hypothetical protein
MKSMKSNERKMKSTMKTSQYIPLATGPLLGSLYESPNFISVSSRHVLFPAHCVESKKTIITTEPEFSKFIFHNNLEEDGPEYHAISEIIVHPDWDTLTKQYEADIAIAILEEPVEFSSNVTNICLNSPLSPVDDDFVGENGTVAGLGHTESSLEPVEELRAVTVPIVDRDECTESPVFREIYSETLFCAGDTEQKAGPCKGENDTLFYFNFLFFISFDQKVTLAVAW